MRRYFLLVLALFSIGLSFGQNTFKKNDIYIEAGGNGLFGSLNYERQLTGKPGLGARIGVGFYSEKAFYLTVPVGINYLVKLKGGRSFIDAGLGVTWALRNGDLLGESTTYKDDHFESLVPSVGYRLHTLNNLMWRISVTPVANEFGFVPWLGVSVGKRL